MTRENLLKELLELLEKANLRELDLIYRTLKNMITG